jgi:hypothetical protein
VFADLVSHSGAAARLALQLEHVFYLPQMTNRRFPPPWSVIAALPFPPLHELRESHHAENE